MVYARNIAKLKAEVRQEQLAEQARRQEGELVQRQQSELARVRHPSLPFTALHCTSCSSGLYVE
jgi:hypothetical protein